MMMSSTTSSNKNDQKSSEADHAVTATPPTTKQTRLFASLPQVLLGHRTSDYGDIISSPITLKNR